MQLRPSPDLRKGRRRAFPETLILARHARRVEIGRDRRRCPTRARCRP